MLLLVVVVGGVTVVGFFATEISRRGTFARFNRRSIDNALSAVIVATAVNTTATTATTTTTMFGSSCRSSFAFCSSATPGDARWRKEHSFPIAGRGELYLPDSSL